MNYATRTANPAAMDWQKQRLEDKGVPYTFSITRSTEIIRWGKGQSLTYSQIDLSKDEMDFVRLVKNHILKLKIKKKPTRKIYYFMRKKHLQHWGYDSCLQIDINKAYWNTARKLGYISDKIYFEGLQFQKGVLLIALGSVARCRQHFRYCPATNQKIWTGEEVNNRTRSYYLDISHEIDRTMLSASSKRSSVLFYWADAIFCKYETPQQMEDCNKVKLYLENRGYQTKTKDIEWIRPQNGVVWSKEVGEAPKPYMFNNSKCSRTRMEFITRSVNRLFPGAKIKVDLSKMETRANNVYL